MSGQCCENYHIKWETVHCYPEMFTTVACDQRWPDVGTGISAQFLNFALFCFAI